MGRIIPKHNPLFISSKPCLIFSFRFYTGNIAYIVEFELKYTFVVIRYALFVSTSPYYSISISIKSIDSVMRQTTLRIFIGTNRHYSSVLLRENIYAAIIFRHPYSAFSILRNTVYKVRLIAPTFSNIFQPFVFLQIISPHTCDAIYPNTLFPIYKQRIA